MVEESPFDKGKSLQIKENNKRIRYLTEEEISRLLEECKHQKHLHRIVTCALNTGRDRVELLKLKWDQVRDGFIYLGKYKTRPTRQVPVNDDLGQVFKEIRKRDGLKSKHVFIYNSRTIHRIDRAFKGALRRAWIENFMFKDLGTPSQAISL